MNNLPAALPPLTLAYVGDAVYELYIRRRLVSQGQTQVRLLHRQAVAYVRATTQARLVHLLENQLLPAEKEIIRRGRNAKPGRIPKGTEMIDYRYSTGLECLVGYLYLAGEERRLEEIFGLLFNLVERETGLADFDGNPGR